MAKQNRSGQQDDGEISFTLIKFSMKASDTGLQKGIDAIRSAFAQAGIVLPQQETRQLRSNNPNLKSVPETPEPVIDGIASEVVDAEVKEDRKEQVGAKKVSSPRTKHKVKNYTVIEDPGFNTTTPKLSEFANQKSPSSDAMKFLVIAYWFKHHLNQPNVSNEAFYTAFRTLGWTVPTDIAANVRELRASRDQRLVRGSDAKTSTIALLGEKAVDRIGVEEP